MAERRSPTLMRAVNIDVRAAVHADDFDRVPFFCECDQEGCFQRLWLTLCAFDLMVGCEGFQLAPGHLHRGGKVAGGQLGVEPIRCRPPRQAAL